MDINLQLNNNVNWSWIITGREYEIKGKRRFPTRRNAIINAMNLCRKMKLPIENVI